MRKGVRIKMWTPLDDEQYDRIDVNEMDGKVFYGYDDDEQGTTEWYDEEGNLDWIEKR